MIYLTDGKRHLITLPYNSSNMRWAGFQLGLHRAWFHDDHWDIPVRRRKEIEALCYKVSPKLIVEITRRGNFEPQNYK